MTTPAQQIIQASAGGNSQAKQNIALSASGGKYKSYIDAASRGFKVPEPPKAIPAPPIAAVAAAITPPRVEPTFQAAPQEKAKPARAGKKLDESLLTSKKPFADFNKEQRIATPGETVPIVFGKRANSIGGIWVQPSLLKSGTRAFAPSFLYAISQGEIVSSPVAHRTWAGAKRVKFIPNVSATLTHNYITAAALAAAPTVCPIGGSTLFCGIETVSFLNPIAKAEENATFQELYPAIGYVGFGEITLGIGDTENTVYYFKNADSTVFRSDTGADVTSAWNTFFSIGAGTEFVLNSEIVGGQIKGRAVGTILDFIDDSFESFGKDIVTDLADDAYLIYLGICDRVDTQVDPLQPASTGTLFGVQSETRWSPYEDPTSTPTANNSAFADITFLQIAGDITERESDENGRSLTPKQLSIYYAQGVKVDLYSGGLVGGVYPRGASNQLVDLVMYLFTIYKQANGAATADIASPIFTGNLTSIAAFCDEYDLYFNGVLDETVNIIDIAATLAPYFLLSFLSLGGQYRFEPLLPLTGNAIKLTALTPAATFTEDEILPGSFSKSFRAVSDRQDFIAVMLYREANPSEIGIQRTKQVAYTTTALDAPVEQFDMTDFCASPDHAVIYAKYELAKRKFSTHSISFQTALITTGLKPTDIIKIQRQRISSRGDNRTEIEWYQITGITYGTDGGSTIEAEHFPVSSSDIAEISNSIVNGSFRVL